MKLIFIRHGEPDYVNDSLTEKGRREAKLLASRMKNIPMDEIYVSPLGRAQDTCNETLAATGRMAVTLPWLKEFYIMIDEPQAAEHGKRRIPWDFMPGFWTKQQELYDKDGWVDSPIMATGPVKENYEAVIRGIDSILNAHGYTRDGQIYKTEQGSSETLVFFCHLGVQFVILSYLLGVSAPVLWQSFFVAPASVTILSTEERIKGEAAFRCKQLGDTSHLYAGGEPLSDSGFFIERM